MLLYEDTIKIAEFDRKAYLLEKKKLPKYLKMLN